MAKLKRSFLEDARILYARMMAAAAGATDPRFERVIGLVPREAFLPPGPWQLMINGRSCETPGADPAHLYQNVLVALDRTKGINNGEPFLHARLLAAAAPAIGDVVMHVGTGTGYYTALLAAFVAPGGKVAGYEIEADLATQARRNLEAFENATVIAGDATALAIPASDLIYVNAGIVEPPLGWLQALKPGGRLLFPWRPADDIGLAVVVTRHAQGFAVAPITPSWFIACVGASSMATSVKKPTHASAWSVKSVWPIAEREPDETAIAIYEKVWFSSTAVAAA